MEVVLIEVNSSPRDGVQTLMVTPLRAKDVDKTYYIAEAFWVTAEQFNQMGLKIVALDFPVVKTSMEE